LLKQFIKLICFKQGKTASYLQLCYCIRITDGAMGLLPMALQMIYWHLLPEGIDYDNYASRADRAQEYCR
jgi:hypothetical protein